MMVAEPKNPVDEGVEALVTLVLVVVARVVLSLVTDDRRRVTVLIVGVVASVGVSTLTDDVARGVDVRSPVMNVRFVVVVDIGFVMNVGRLVIGVEEPGEERMLVEVLVIEGVSLVLCLVFCNEKFVVV